MTTVSDSICDCRRKIAVISMILDTGTATFTETLSSCLAVLASTCTSFTRMVMVAPVASILLSARMSLTSLVIVALLVPGWVPVRQARRAASLRACLTRMPRLTSMAPMIRKMNSGAISANSTVAAARRPRPVGCGKDGINIARSSKDAGPALFPAQGVPAVDAARQELRARDPGHAADGDRHDHRDLVPRLGGGGGRGAVVDLDGHPLPLDALRAPGT